MIELVTECGVGIPKPLVDLISFLKNNEINETKQLLRLSQFVTSMPHSSERKKRRFCDSCLEQPLDSIELDVGL
jgi:hypothetical protein